MQFSVQCEQLLSWQSIQDWRGSNALLGFCLRHIQNPFPYGKEISRLSHPILQSQNRQEKLWVSCPRKTASWKNKK